MEGTCNPHICTSLKQTVYSNRTHYHRTRLFQIYHEMFFKQFPEILLKLLK